ncbi:MAG: nitrogenase iron-molybdenum cofactor biosynthesis protein NifE [Hydrogenothermaceae bacterium]|nr:nitrogenase iron-molybdenum cofactor biosynthesis protein NifE [Hydrogenothermaceae bacterium]
MFVYSTCVTAMIGDDLDSACKKASEEIGIPVIPVHSPGFVGSKNLGNKLAGKSLLDHVIGTGEPPYITPYDINLIGEYNIAGELWQVMPAFKDLGIRILSSISGDSTYREITYAHRSKLNVVVCSKALVSLAEEMKQKYGIPFIEGSFYGIRETSKTLISIAKAFGDKGLLEKTLKYTREREKETRERLKQYIPLLKGKKVFLYTGGVKSWSMVYMLEELGMEVIGTSIRKSTKKDIEKLKHEFEKKQKILLEKGGAKDILRIMKEEKGDILLAGGRNMYTAIKGKYPFLDVNQERVYPYAGYSGIVEMAKHLVNTLYSPVWKYVKDPFMGS